MHARVLGVGCRAVIALLVILDREFPICGDVVRLVRRHLEILEIEQRHRLGQVFFGPLERRRLVREAHKHESVNGIDRHRLETVLRQVEVVRHVARCRQVAVDVVHPAVVRAHELACVAAGLETNQRATMAAYICEAFQGSVSATNDNRGLICNIQYFEIARLRQLGLMTSKNPVTRDNPVKLELINRWICVKALLQRVARLLAGDQLFNRSSVFAHRLLFHSATTYSQSKSVGVAWEVTHRKGVSLCPYTQTTVISLRSTPTRQSGIVFSPLPRWSS